MMKTMMEIQHKEVNVKDTNIDKFVKEDLKNKGIKTTEVDTLNIYYIPEKFSICYVAVKKDGSEVKEELNAKDVPDYPETPVAKKAPAKKAVAKKPAAKKAAAKK